MLLTELLLFFVLLCPTAHPTDHPPVINSDIFLGTPFTPGQSYLSLLLLVLTVGLSGSVYLCVLRYICKGCCQPVLVGPEDENVSGVV